MTPPNSFQQMDDLHREIDRAFEDFFPQMQPSFPMAFLPGRFARAYPLINLHEDKDHMYVEAMAPGLNPESLNLTVVHNTLTISGEKRGAPNDIPPEAFHREERASGKFVRTITLPVEIDESTTTTSSAVSSRLIGGPTPSKAEGHRSSSFPLPNALRLGSHRFTASWMFVRSRSTAALERTGNWWLSPMLLGSSRCTQRSSAA